MILVLLGIISFLALLIEGLIRGRYFVFVRVKIERTANPVYYFLNTAFLGIVVIRLSLVLAELIQAS